PPTTRGMQPTAELTPAQRRTLEGLIGTDERPVFAVDGVPRGRDRIEEAARAVEPPERAVRPGAHDRPVFAVDGVPRVRDRIEEAARAFEPPEPLWLGKSNLSDLHRCPGLFDAVRAGERAPFAFSARTAAGRLAHKAIELEVAGRDERDPHELVEHAAERLTEDGAFSAYWGGAARPAPRRDPT